jgi:hypothetical protein
LHVADEHVIVLPPLTDATLPEPVSVKLRSTPCTKVAMTVFAAVIVIEHAAVPVQAPDQPENNQPDTGVAVSVTAAPEAYGLLQLAVHEIELPPPTKATLPEPERFKPRLTAGTNVAVTDFAALMVVVQGAVPAHAPNQPPKARPLPGVAVSVTDVPDL